jgi:hypothetical protein
MVVFRPQPILRKLSRLSKAFTSFATHFVFRKHLRLSQRSQPLQGCYASVLRGIDALRTWMGANANGANHNTKNSNLTLPWIHHDGYSHFVPKSLERVLSCKRQLIFWYACPGHQPTFLTAL